MTSPRRTLLVRQSLGRSQRRSAKVQFKWLPGLFRLQGPNAGGRKLRIFLLLKGSESDCALLAPTNSSIAPLTLQSACPVELWKPIAEGSTTLLQHRCSYISGHKRDGDKGSQRARLRYGLQMFATAV